jgi:hypothetical protein
MLPGIRPVNNVSLLNSIFELKDFASLPRSLKKIKDTALAARYWLSTRKISSWSTKHTLKSILQTSADSYLQAEFNVLPLLSDITSVQDAIRRVRNDLKELVARANKPQKRYFQVPLLDYYKSSHESFAANCPSWMVASQLLYSRYVSYPVSQFTATMEYSYSLPSWTTEDSLLQALLDELGVNLSPRIIWNALPWSFVIDWLFGVNRWLDNWQTRNIEPVVNIRGFCWSTHVRRVITTSFGAGFNNPCVEFQDDAYKRVVPERSALYSSLTTSGLDPKEFSLAAALAYTRLGPRP